MRRKEPWLIGGLILSMILIVWLIYFPLFQYPRPITRDTGKTVPRTIHYAVEVNPTELLSTKTFQQEIKTVLSDTWGWSRAGVQFESVTSNPDVTYVLTTGTVIKTASPLCDSYYNCTVKDHIFINAERWMRGEGWHGDFKSYHALIINHETGHFIGLNHWTCLCAFQPAPVMLTHQNVTTFHVWRSNAWPTTQELSAAKEHLQ